MKLLTLFLVLLLTAPLRGSEKPSGHGRKIPVKAVYKEVTLDAGIDSVWTAWTTPRGLETFFAPRCSVKLEVYGPFEILFFPDADPGSRGAEDCIVLAFQPEEMLSFTWSAPPQFPDIRKQRTSVVVRFFPLSERRTKVTLTQTGWGEGGNWDRTYDYFDRAWDIVLGRLAYRFTQGAVDWSDPPGITTDRKTPE